MCPAGTHVQLNKAEIKSPMAGIYIVMRKKKRKKKGEANQYKYIYIYIYIYTIQKKLANYSSKEGSLAKYVKIYTY